MTASADLMEGWGALDRDAPRYEEALGYYRGTITERFATERIRELVARSGQAYKFRLAAIPVRVMAKRCRIAHVTSDSETLTNKLEEIRLANQAVIHESLIIRKAFTFGDAYAFVWPVESTETGDQEDGELVDVAAAAPLRAAGVEISYQSPLHCRVIYDSEDGRRPRFALRRWKEGDRWRAEVWYADRVEAWVARDRSGGGSEEDWEPYADDESGTPVLAEEGVNWPEPHEHGEIPIKHARTDLPYGEPVHAAAFGPQDAITKAITTSVLVGIEAYGWPERYRLLEDQRQLEHGGEPVAWDDVADAPAASHSPTASARRRGAGIEHVLAGTKAVGEYAAPEPSALIPSVEHWVRLMSVVTETPLYELDPTVQMSGVSRDKADAPLRAKEREAKAYLEGFWREVYGLALKMTAGAPGTVSIHWAPPEVVMDTDWWTVAQTRLNMGVPIRQILAEANYLPDQIDEWLNTVGEDMALMQRIATLRTFGEALEKLGNGIQLGVLSQDAANGVVQRIVGEMTAE